MTGPDPKPARRIIDPQARRRKLLREPRCRLCSEPARDAHHLIGRGQRGDDVEENLIPVCGAGNVSGCHGRLHAGDLEARTELRERLRPEETSYAIAKVGAGRFDLLYPPRIESAS